MEVLIVGLIASLITMVMIADPHHEESESSDTPEQHRFSKAVNRMEQIQSLCTSFEYFNGLGDQLLFVSAS